jgi:nucleobase:cation symporter-1, NCS1 family
MGSVDEGATGTSQPTFEYEAFTVEQRGIDIIPPEERKSTPAALFWIWAGSIFNIEYVVYGALLIVVGLSFGQAVGIIIAGNIVSWILLGLASVQAPDAGTTTFMLSRAPFGTHGARGVSVFNWLTQVGYETEGITLVVLALLAILAKAGVHDPSDVLKVVLIVLAASVQLVLPFFGHATISKTFKVLSYLFMALFVVLAILAAGKVHLNQLHQHAGGGTLVAAFALAIALGGLGWTENANDYSRYIPKETSKRSIFLAAAAGGMIPAILLEILGGAVATTVKNANDPISGLPHVFPGWFLVPYLIVAIVQLFVINTMDLYSSGLTLQAIGVRLRRWQAVFIDTVICAILTGFVIFSNSFNKVLSDFVLFTIVWIAPWFGIFFVDWLLRRGRYDPLSLVRESGGLYFRNGGIHWPAVIAQAAGMFAAMMWINAYPVYFGPLTNRTNGADLSWLVGLLVGAVVYLVLAANRVRREAELPVAP